MSDGAEASPADRLVDPAARDDDRVDTALRPQELDGFIGQAAVRENDAAPCG